MPIQDPIERKEYNRNWINTRRLFWLKANGPCSHCGSSEDLECDHIDPTQKKYQPSGIWSRKEEVREEELKKCQVLCKRCHQKKTNQEKMAVPVPHGTESGYTGRACRCNACTEAHRATKKEYRACRRAAGSAYK